ncbi:interleukin-17 receptor B [Tiliqua scincoides]|uniref:interleukin-17 receptor B n=1 Tax=Tiliqua scincoides TaxID=71010 RepID=UPI0034618BD9
MHSHTPSDIYNLSVQIVEAQGTSKFNISWVLNEDASIKFLNATRLCVSTSGQSTCMRCDYTEKFQSQTMPNREKWHFFYVGFHVEENTFYTIYASNLPSANLGEDPPTKHISLISPDCKDDQLKYDSNCKEKGSLWDPNITVCNMDSEVEVNFTANRYSPMYRVILCGDDEEDDDFECTSHLIKLPAEENDSRVSVRIPVSNENKKIFEQLIPYFPKCGNDCRRRSKHLLLCTKKPGVINLVVVFAGIFTALSLMVVILAVVYFKKRNAAIRRRLGFHPGEHYTPAKILVIYSQEVCIQHTVLPFAEFLHECCHCDVIIDVWQKLRIAEIGLVQWLATQKEIADKVIFLRPGDPSPECDLACKKIVENYSENSECMFTLAFNLFCSDWKNQSSLFKYMVVSFKQTHSTKKLPSALKIFPHYFLMKDIDSFCRDICLSQSSVYRHAVVQLIMRILHMHPSMPA